MEGNGLGRRTIARVSVYSTPALRVGVYRCPPGNALWHETNDNIGARPHVVFPDTAVGLVRDGVRLTVTPNDVVLTARSRPTSARCATARGDISLFISNTSSRKKKRLQRLGCVVWFYLWVLGLLRYEAKNPAPVHLTGIAATWRAACRRLTAATARGASTDMSGRTRNRGTVAVGMDGQAPRGRAPPLGQQSPGASRQVCQPTPALE